MILLRIGKSISNLEDVKKMIKKVYNKELIFNRLKEDVFQFAYHIGDLDDFFFSYCTWFALLDKGKLKDVILLYSGLSIPTLLVFGSSNYIPTLIKGIIKDLPQKFYCHYQEEYTKYFHQHFKIQPLGTHFKMKLSNKYVNKTHMKNIKCIQFKQEDEEILNEFYQIAYPNGYFESYMLQTGKYYGIKLDDEIKSVAGVHVYSEKYRTAVLGNISTHPNMRGKGLAKNCILELLDSFKGKIDYVGLNVKEDNSNALNLYKKLGFSVHSVYKEGLFQKEGE